MTGTAVDYPPSVLVIKPKPKGSETPSESPAIPSKQVLASGIPIGMRLPNQQVINQASARACQLQPRLTSDGRFRILIFGGDISQSDILQRVNTLGAYLSEKLLPQYTSSQPWAEKKIPVLDCVIEVLLIHAAARDKIELLRDLHDVYHPLDKEFGYDYDKVFADGKDYMETGGKAYLGYEIDKERGCVVIVRPDQYISWIGDLEDVKEIECFFGNILIEQGDGSRAEINL
jgi:phenol 2-monooxygenase (NADPH)